MGNRIKELREESGLSIRKLSDALKEKGVSLSADSISKYERGLRSPKIENWQKLADFFDVQVPYIMGTSEHRGDLKDWSKVTGYSEERIKKELSRLEQAHRLTGETKQAKIDQAVKNLDGWGNDEYSVVLNLARDIRGMVYKYLDPYFYDFEAMEKERKRKKLDPRLIQPPIYYDDMRRETYMKVDAIISETARKLSELAYEIKDENIK